MADHQFSLCLITTMDHLWFHRIILFSEATLKPTSESLTCPSLSLSFSSASDEVEEIISSSPLQDEDKSSNSSPISTSLDDSNIDDEDKDMNLKERPTRLNLIRNRTRSQSSSPSTQVRRPNRSRRYSRSKLEKSMSCRSLMDLELEEVKGFMDLGFKFNKEYLTPRMMSVLPGLKRVQLHNKKEITCEVAKDDDDENEIEQEEYERGKTRPYLSEAWLIKRPDSPLLNLRMPRVSAPADMKKHIRFWAKTVASAVQQEC